MAQSQRGLSPKSFELDKTLITTARTNLAVDIPPSGTQSAIQATPLQCLSQTDVILEQPLKLITSPSLHNQQQQQQQHYLNPDISQPLLHDQPLPAGSIKL